MSFCASEESFYIFRIKLNSLCAVLCHFCPFLLWVENNTVREALRSCIILAFHYQLQGHAHLTVAAVPRALVLPASFYFCKFLSEKPPDTTGSHLHQKSHKTEKEFLQKNEARQLYKAYGRRYELMWRCLQEVTWGLKDRHKTNRRKKVKT